MGSGLTQSPSSDDSVSSSSLLLSSTRSYCINLSSSTLLSLDALRSLRCDVLRVCWKISFSWNIDKNQNRRKHRQNNAWTNSLGQTTRTSHGCTNTHSRKSKVSVSSSFLCTVPCSRPRTSRFSRWTFLRWQPCRRCKRYCPAPCRFVEVNSLRVSRARRPPSSGGNVRNSPQQRDPQRQPAATGNRENTHRKRRGRPRVRLRDVRDDKCRATISNNARERQRYEDDAPSAVISVSSSA